MPTFSKHQTLNSKTSRTLRTGGASFAFADPYLCCSCLNLLLQRLGVGRLRGVGFAGLTEALAQTLMTFGSVLGQDVPRVYDGRPRELHIPLQVLKPFRIHSAVSRYSSSIWRLLYDYYVIHRTYKQVEGVSMPAIRPYIRGHDFKPHRSHRP